VAIGVPVTESRRTALVQSGGTDLLRAFSIATGLGWALQFPILGVRNELQLYADGALFSYAVAAQDVWTFHWHNISGRLFVYLTSLLPAEIYVGLTKDARGGIAAYGFLFFVAPLAGLAATFALDRSPRRTLFAFACGSTACICPLVFGFPTEMWIAYAVFWPALTACHYAHKGPAGFALVLALMLALVLSHEGALIGAGAILATTLLRGTASPIFRRAAFAAGIALLVWVAVKLLLRPDPYIAQVLESLALNVFDLSTLGGNLVLLLFCTLAGYAILFRLLGRLRIPKPEIAALCVLAILLVIHWLWFDGALHAEDRYCLRTALIVVTPIFGTLGAAFALQSSEGLHPAFPIVQRLTSVLTAILPVRAATGMLLLVTLVHAVETAKFVTAWTGYKTALRSLATGPASNPLGDPRFVSAEQLGAAHRRLSWATTVPFLSILVTPNFAPARLAVTPEADFFWIPCETATASLETSRALPRAARELIRAYSCLHRRNDG
jgi:hypothetical protein